MRAVEWMTDATPAQLLNVLPNPSTHDTKLRSWTRLRRQFCINGRQEDGITGGRRSFKLQEDEQRHLCFPRSFRGHLRRCWLD